MNHQKPVAGVAVFRADIHRADDFAIIMAGALEALSHDPGFGRAIQMESLDDPSLFADVVEWASPDAALAAEKWAETSAACQPYFALTLEDLIFGLTDVPRELLARAAGGNGEVVQIVRPEDRHHLAAVLSTARAARGCIAAEGGLLQPKEGPSFPLALLVWDGRQSAIEFPSTAFNALFRVARRFGSELA